MAMTVNTEGLLVRATLSGDLSVADLAVLKGQLLPALDAEGTLLVDAEHLTRLDTSVVQLFLYAARCVRALRVEVGSPAWVSAWATLGLSPSEQASTTE